MVIARPAATHSTRLWVAVVLCVAQCGTVWHSVGGGGAVVLWYCGTVGGSAAVWEEDKTFFGAPTLL